jgi:23S rRNA (cytidine1920-2'-O)/16S rRNA (cytidine1409-2'-O)-methyltransferase
VGRGNVGKGGVVADQAARLAAVEAVKSFVMASGWTVRGATDSPIEGGDGNREFLLWATR